MVVDCVAGGSGLYGVGESAELAGLNKEESTVYMAINI